MNSYDCRCMMRAAVLLMLLPVAFADSVCVTSESGNTVCQNKLTTATIVAIVLIIILSLALIGTLGFLFYRRRKFAAAKAAVAANAYVIEASQMKGPAAFTTYSATYDPRSAPHGVVGLPTKPGSAKTTPQTAPTTYGGVTYPFTGHSSGTPSKSQSAFSGTYTTMSGINSGGKSAV